MKPLPGQMVLDLFPEEYPKWANPLESVIRWLVDEWLCPEEDVRPYVERAFREFGRPEAVGLGMFDASIEYHVFWDRCWAALWIGPEEAASVSAWHYNYRQPYTGAPVDVWYIDNDGREVRRPYEG